eukprot:scaffold566_cov364-Pavlova_lutheri.AAC.16
MVDFPILRGIAVGSFVHHLIQPHLGHAVQAFCSEPFVSRAQPQVSISTAFPNLRRGESERLLDPPEASEPPHSPGAVLLLVKGIHHIEERSSTAQQRPRDPSMVSTGPHVRTTLREVFVLKDVEIFQELAQRLLILPSIAP